VSLTSEINRLKEDNKKCVELMNDGKEEHKRLEGLEI
jgi:hypothetical protein